MGGHVRDFRDAVTFGSLAGRAMAQNPYTKGRRAHGAWAKGYELGKSNTFEKFDSRQADVRAAFGEGWKAGQAERVAS